MLPTSNIRRLASVVMALAMVVVAADALLTYQVTVPGNVNIVTPGSIPLIRVYRDAARTLNLTQVDYPTTEPFNGPLPSVQSVWVQNIYSQPVSLTVTMTGLPSGISFSGISTSIPVGTSVALGTLNVTMTTSAATGPSGFTVVFSAVVN